MPRSLDLRDPNQVCILNAALVNDGPGGVIPMRFPQAALDSFTSMGNIPHLPTGVEVQFRARPTRITLRVRVLDTDNYGICCELYRGANKLLPTWRLDPTSREPQEQSFDVWTPLNNYPRPDVPYRLVFPTHTLLEVLEVRLDDGDCLLPMGTPYTYNALAPADARPLTWLAHGDSITQGANVTCPTASWLDLAARQLGVHPVNLGVGGHGRCELPMAHYLATRTDADLLTLHIGVNSPPAEAVSGEYQPRFDQYIGIIRAGLPSTPIVVFSPLWSCRDYVSPREATPAVIRDAQRQVCAARCAAGDTSLHYIDGLSLGIGEADTLNDFLHLPEAGCTKLANALIPILQPIIDSLRA